MARMIVLKLTPCGVAGHNYSEVHPKEFTGTFSENDLKCQKEKLATGQPQPPRNHRTGTAAKWVDGQELPVLLFNIRM